LRISITALSISACETIADFFAMNTTFRSFERNERRSESQELILLSTWTLRKGQTVVHKRKSQAQLGELRLALRFSSARVAKCG
jgi:hypothetical protein